jgi:hypothetical protein
VAGPLISKYIIYALLEAMGSLLVLVYAWIPCVVCGELHGEKVGSLLPNWVISLLSAGASVESGERLTYFVLYLLS